MEQNLTNRMLSIMEKTAALEEGPRSLGEIFKGLLTKGVDWAKENPELSGAGAGSLAGSLLGSQLGKGMKGTVAGGLGGAGLGAAIGNILNSDVENDPRLVAPDDPEMMESAELALLPVKGAIKAGATVAKHPIMAAGGVAGTAGVAHILRERALAGGNSNRLHRMFMDRTARNAMNPTKFPALRNLFQGLTGGNVVRGPGGVLIYPGRNLGAWPAAAMKKAVNLSPRLKKALLATLKYVRL